MFNDRDKKEIKPDISSDILEKTNCYSFSDKPIIVQTGFGVI